MSTDPFEDRLKRAVPPATVSVPVFGYRRDGTQPGGPAGGKRREAAGQPGATALRDLPVMLPARREPQRVWDTLAAIRLDDTYLRRNRLIPTHRNDPAGTAFDILRTQIIQAIGERGWRRVAVTSPTPGCGKSFVAANLALSLARRQDFRSVLVDLDLRNPDLAAQLGVAEPGRLRDMLTGEQPIESHLRRVGPSLALALNDTAEPDAAEVIQTQATAAALAALEEAARPDLVLFDLPPMLVSDDVLSALPLVDCVLLVSDGTRTTAAEIAECERLLDGRSPLLGVVLNKAAGSRRRAYPAG